MKSSFWASCKWIHTVPLGSEYQTCLVFQWSKVDQLWNGWPHSKTVRLKRPVFYDSGIPMSGFGIRTVYRKYNAHYWFEISFFNFSLPRSSDSTSASVARPTTTTTRAAFVAPSSARHPSTGPSTTEELSKSCKRLEQQSPLIPITTCNFVPRCLIIKVFTNVC